MHHRGPMYQTDPGNHLHVSPLGPPFAASGAAGTPMLRWFAVSWGGKCYLERTGLQELSISTRG